MNSNAEAGLITALVQSHQSMGFSPDSFLVTHSEATSETPLLKKENSNTPFCSIDFVEPPSQFIEVKKDKTNALEFDWHSCFPNDLLTVLTTSQMDTSN